MSAEPQRDDDPDFLDDFIIEDDGTAKDEDLDTLFEDPSPLPNQAKATPPGQVPATTPPGVPDADDLLFTDHSQGLQASESFPPAPGFAEQANSSWQGDGLELDPPGVPAEAERALQAPLGQDAEASFTAELDSLLQSEDEFALDSEKELELIETSDSLLDGAVPAEEMIVIDDGAGTWQEGDAVEATAANTEESTTEEGEAALPLVDGELEPIESVADETAATEPGWESLPSTSMDDLAEVDEVARDEGETGEVAAEELEEPVVDAAPARRPALVGGGVAPDENEELYAESAPSGPTGVVGGRQRSGRTLRLVGSLAASLALVAAGAIAVLQPEWFGLRFAPEQVQSVQVQRPRVDLEVPPPPPVAAEVAAVVPQVRPDNPVTEPPVPPPVPPPVEPPPADPKGQVVVVDPVPVTPPPVVVEPVVEPVVAPPVSPVASAPTPVVVPVPKAAPVDGDPHWPVGKPTSNGKHVAVAAIPNGASPPGLVRIGDDLMVGQEDGKGRAVEGMLPGSRAFAQLYNGNFFIGSVKFASHDQIVLRVGTGEVTLQVASLSKLTELGSSDYEELQKVTSGFVRLTNNNRLVGGILSSIADDHVVLEFRSNRVMLPKSAIGEVVQGEGDTPVRLSTTREEDDWLRRLVERQLGTGTAPNEPKVPPAAPPAGQRGNK